MECWGNMQSSAKALKCLIIIKIRTGFSTSIAKAVLIHLHSPPKGCTITSLIGIGTVHVFLQSIVSIPTAHDLLKMLQYCVTMRTLINSSISFFEDDRARVLDCSWFRQREPHTKGKRLLRMWLKTNRKTLWQFVGWQPCKNHVQPWKRIWFNAGRNFFPQPSASGHKIEFVRDRGGAGRIAETLHWLHRLSALEM